MMFKVLTEGCDPTRGSKYSACVDLYAAEDVTIGAGETKLVGLGVALDVSIPMGDCTEQKAKKELDKFKSRHYLQLMLRSSLGKKGLIIPNGVGVIDLDYKDEIKMIIHNPVRRPFLDLFTTMFGWGFLRKKYIKKGDKIAQITLLEHKGYLFGIDTEEERDGGFGSTGERR
jgi:dUTPase